MSMYTITYVRETRRLPYKRTCVRKIDTHQISEKLTGYIQAITQSHRAMWKYVQYLDQGGTTTQPTYIP